MLEALEPLLCMLKARLGMRVKVMAGARRYIPAENFPRFLMTMLPRIVWAIPDVSIQNNQQMAKIESAIVSSG